MSFWLNAMEKSYWHFVEGIRVILIHLLWQVTCGQYSNLNQLKWKNVDSTFVLCVTLCMEKRKKCKELSVDLRENIVEKHGQSEGYKWISRDLNVPASTVRNIIKRITAHGTVDNAPECGRKSKINEKLQWRIVRMVDKVPKSIRSKQIQADLQTQVSARTIRRHLNGKGRPRRTPLLTQSHKKQDWSRPKLVWQNHNPSGRTYCGQMREN